MAPKEIKKKLNVLWATSFRTNALFASCIKQLILNNPAYSHFP